ncbi:MAG TPA: hypothetical protein PL128_04175 [Ginsengibacter sp.]|nr:hypothetical protein [Ginsengibacter sp.]
MKKVTLYFLAASMIAISCSKDKPGSGPEENNGPDIETPSTGESGTFPTKIVLVAGSETTTYNISYLPNSNKIEKIDKGNAGLETFEYEGDLIKKIAYGNSDGNYRKYEYSNNQLSRETYYNNGQTGEKNEYTYPSEKKVTMTNYEYNNGVWTKGGTFNLEFDSKGNLIKGSGGATEMNEMAINLSYDLDKSSPILNITGWQKANLTGGGIIGDNVDISDLLGRRNNPTQTSLAMLGEDPLVLNYSYEYTDSRHPTFPTKITGKNGDNPVFTATITYR